MSINISTPALGTEAEKLLKLPPFLFFKILVTQKIYFFLLSSEQTKEFLYLHSLFPFGDIIIPSSNGVELKLGRDVEREYNLTSGK